MLNRAEIIGHLGKDPKVFTYQDGTKTAIFSVATSEKGYTSKTGIQVPERTEWHNIVLHGAFAKVAEQYLSKGSKVYVSGKLRTRKYEDKAHIERTITEIHADFMEMLGGEKQQQAQEQQSQAQQNPYPAFLDPEDVSPF